jgi:hypothetical protein
MIPQGTLGGDSMGPRANIGLLTRIRTLPTILLYGNMFVQDGR